MATQVVIIAKLCKAKLRGPKGTLTLPPGGWAALEGEGRGEKMYDLQIKSKIF